MRVKEREKWLLNKSRLHLFFCGFFCFSVLVLGLFFNIQNFNLLSFILFIHFYLFYYPSLY